MAAPKNSKWFREILGPGEGHLHEIKSVLCSKDSPFQHIEVIEFGDYGLALVLDGKVQSTQRDEFIYHEALVHPVLLTHPDPQRIMIIGGGEGATLREALRHRSITKAVMVDIDRDVVEIAQALLPEFHGGAFQDPRAELVIADARHWLENYDGLFDVVIIDISDPIEEGPCYRLYTREFYNLLTKRLAADGMISLQSGTVAPHDLLNFSAIHRTLRTAFPTVWPYSANVPCFGLPWGFQLASKLTLAEPCNSGEYQARIRQRIRGELKYLNAELCRAQFVLPEYLRARLTREERVIEDAAPLFISR
jgi:spermidine synthase